MKTKFFLMAFIGIFMLTIARCSKDDDTPVVKDIDGNSYKIVSIGDQTWMAENLKVTKYSNGDVIETTTTDNLDISGETDPKYQWAYDSSAENLNTYGRLYTWYTIADSRSLCPAGWHVPTETDWTELIIEAGGTLAAGATLKESGTNHWVVTSAEVTNETGFTALPGGMRISGGIYSSLESQCFFWSATSVSGSQATMLTLSAYSGSTDFIDFDKKSGLSVRCIKD
jgi:uncharacterized protein (TIGR02145 family)